jgi:hypothetical protein
MAGPPDRVVGAITALYNLGCSGFTYRFMCIAGSQATWGTFPGSRPGADRLGGWLGVTWL